MQTFWAWVFLKSGGTRREGKSGVYRRLNVGQYNPKTCDASPLAKKEIHADLQKQGFSFFFFKYVRCRSYSHTAQPALTPSKKYLKFPKMRAMQNFIYVDVSSWDLVLFECVTMMMISIQL